MGLVLERYHYYSQLKVGSKYIEELRNHMLGFHFDENEFQLTQVQEDAHYFRFLGRQYLLNIQPFPDRNGGLIVVHLRPEMYLNFEPASGAWIESNLKFRFDLAFALNSKGEERNENIGNWMIELLQTCRIQDDGFSIIEDLLTFLKVNEIMVENDYKSFSDNHVFHLFGRQVLFEFGLKSDRHIGNIIISEMIDDAAFFGDTTQSCWNPLPINVQYADGRLIFHNRLLPKSRMIEELYRSLQNFFELREKDKAQWVKFYGGTM